jgi:HlyD family secretion protein
VTWQGKDVLQVPSGALFRDGDNWAAFVVEAGIVHKRTVKVGHRNSFEVEILEGLKAGDRVILHPSNQSQEGVEVEAR